MSWKSFIDQERSQPYFEALTEFVLAEGKMHAVYPARAGLFNALKLTPLDRVKVLILGQDPYINEGQAHGLAFSVPGGIDIPPSLRNMLKELRSDLGIEPPASGDLTAWARRGVLLLNSVLTVRAGQSGSHAGHGWETFTDRAIALLNGQPRPLVFILLGAYARKKAALITNDHMVLQAAHPSPLSAHNGFFGSKPFSKTNQFLISRDIEPIDWRLV